MESKRVPRKLKWTSIPKDDMASKRCAASGKLPGERKAGGKADREQEGKRSQANWKNTGEAAVDGDIKRWYTNRSRKKASRIIRRDGSSEKKQRIGT